MCIARVQRMSTRSLLICTYTLVCIVSNKGRMPARRRGRFVVWRYGFSQDLKVWTRNRSCLFLCAKLSNTARKLCHQCPLADAWQSKEPTRTNAFLAHIAKKHYLCKAKKMKSNNNLLINKLKWKTNLPSFLFLALPWWWQLVVVRLTVNLCQLLS